MNDSIEALIPTTCPHCAKQIAVKIKVSPPELLGVLKEEELQEIIKKLGDQNDNPQEPAVA